MPNTSALISQWPKSAACYICGTRQRFAHKINRGTSRLAAIHTQKHNCIKISPNRQRSNWIGQERRHFFIRAAKICNLFWLSQKKKKTLSYRIPKYVASSKQQPYHNNRGMLHTMRHRGIHIIWLRLLYIVSK